MLRGKIFEKNEEIRIGGQICPLPVCLGLTGFSSKFNYKEQPLIQNLTKVCYLWLEKHSSEDGDFFLVHIF